MNIFDQAVWALWNTFIFLVVVLLCKRMQKKFDQPQFLNYLFKNAHFHICLSWSVYCWMVRWIWAKAKLYGQNQLGKTPYFSTKTGQSRRLFSMTVIDLYTVKRIRMLPGYSMIWNIIVDIKYNANAMLCELYD